MEAPCEAGLPPERYELTWRGKRRAMQQARESSACMLLPKPEDSLDWESTGHMLVEGDNLDALKLLQATHAARVRLAYIDPPYNTGKDFVYPDSSDHSAWLTMMYPRLLLARELLSPEGVIFVSLDDNEAPNLRLVADEIFGAQNFIATICHKARASVSNDRIISINHNLIALYARDKAAVFARRAEFGLEPELDPAAFPFEDERGRYRLVPVDGPGGAAKGNPFYAFEGVSGHFRYAQSTMREKWNAGLVVKVGQCLQQKYYLAAAAATRRTDTTWWDERLYTATATSRLNALMGAEVFKSPKPTGLVRRMLRLWSRGDGDLVLDFFAGSGTTGHAVLEQNAEDGIRRRYLLVQSPELLHERNPHQCEAAAFCDRLGKPRVLTELTKERLRRAAQRVRQEHPQAGMDTGFRVFSCSPAAECFERNHS